MPWYSTEFRFSLDVQLMPKEAEVCYQRLLEIAWDIPDGGLPDDDSILTVLLGKFGCWWAESSTAVRSKFKSRNGKLYNPRLCDEIEKMKARSEWSKESNKKRWKSKKTTHVSPDTDSGHGLRTRIPTHTHTSELLPKDAAPPPALGAGGEAKPVPDFSNPTGAPRPGEKGYFPDLKLDLKKGGYL